MLISKNILELSSISVTGDWDEWLPRVVIDSRKVESGDLFWAIRGENQDGHEYIASAFERGAAIAAVSEEWAQQNAGLLPEKGVLFVMDDTLNGMQNLAREVRRSLGAHTVALTGSNGKTTTKELIAAGLGTAGITTATRGNFNNHIGLPLTILNATGDERYLVLEMGANHVGEIEMLCEIGHPEYGLITNIGAAHVGEFGGYEMVQQAKGELFRFLGEIGLAIVNLEDEKVVAESAHVKRKIGYSLGTIPDQWNSTIYLGEIVELDEWSRPTILIEGDPVRLKLTGRHWALAAVGAAASAIEMGGLPDQVLPAMEQVEPLAGRGLVIGLDDGVELLDDSYNANVGSIEAALSTLVRRQGSRIAVLGDVLELGEFEEDEHRRIGRIPELEDIDHVIFVGERMSWAAEEATMLGHPSVQSFVEAPMEEIAEAVVHLLEPNAGILVKGSMKIGLDRLVLELQRKRQA